MMLGDHNEEPKDGRDPRPVYRYHVFRDHNCGGCDSGRLPRKEGDHDRCSLPRARND
jgi:hypothetical protein